MNNKIAVVILNWNGKRLLEQFLPSIIEFSSQAIIYVADNASTDNSVDFLKTYYPNIKIINNTFNYGFAKGYNIAIQNVEEEYLCLLNSDVEVSKNWLDPILELFKKQPNTAIIQPKILDYKNKLFFEYAGAAGGFIDKFGFPYCRGRVFQTIEKDTNQYNDEKEIFWASGACFFIRNSVFKKLNGFDDSFFAHQEEIDLCWRSFNAGFKSVYTSKSKVYHVGGATLDQSNPKKTYLNFRNSLFMLTKNLPTNKLFIVLFIRLFLDGIAGLKFLLEGNPKHFLAVLHAHFSYYLNIISNLKKRTSNEKQNYYAKKSIVYQYFVKKQTFYSE